MREKTGPTVTHEAPKPTQDATGLKDVRQMRLSLPVHEDDGEAALFNAAILRDATDS